MSAVKTKSKSKSKAKTKTRTNNVREKRVEDFDSATRKSADIIDIVNELERELDVAGEIQMALQEDLRETKIKLSEESTAHQELREHSQRIVNEQRVAAAEKLREEVSFVEQERDGLNRTLKETEKSLKETIKERDMLVKKLNFADQSIDKLQHEKAKSEARVCALEKNQEDVELLQREIDEENQRNSDLESKVVELTHNQSGIESENNSLKSEVKISQSKLKKLNRNFILSKKQFSTLNNKFSSEKLRNDELQETNHRVEQELKALTSRSKVLACDLKTAKGELDKVLSAATRTAKRFQNQS